MTDNAGGVAGTQQTINLTGSGVTAATAVTLAPTNMTFGSTAVGAISPPQTASVTNTGTQPLNITHILVSTTDYAETDNCLSAPNNGVLGVGSSCTISVTFTPTGSGTRPAVLTIADNASGSPQSILLSGIGAAAFTLLELPNDSITVNPVLIGSTQTTFAIVADAVSNSSPFPGAFTLTCSAGTTCSFSQNPIFVSPSGKPTPTTMTVSNLTPNPSSNPYPFNVTGTSGTQSFTVPISLEFADFSLTATPASFSVPSGGLATYQINVNPIFGLNGQAVSLIISNTAPQLNDYTVQWSNATPTVNSTGPTQVTLGIQTTLFANPAFPTGTHAFPRIPGGPVPPLLMGLLSLAGLVSLAVGHRRRGHTGRVGRGWLALRLGTLSSILALNLAMAACRPNILATEGTATNNYVITIQGTLLNNTSVTRRVTVDLSVTQGQAPQ